MKKFKRPVALVTAALLLMATLWSPLSAKAQSNDILNVKARSAILVDAKTGKILYAKNIDQMYPPASMTKMMTEYLILKAIDKGKITWDTTVPISEKVKELSRNTGFSGFPLRRDYDYHVDGLFDALLIPSNNAAAVAFSELLAGSESKFVNQMNQTAQALGMKNTKYINASGLDNVDLGKFIAQGGPNATDKTTARDLAILAYHLLNDFPKKISDRAIEVASTAEKDFQAGPGEVDHMVSTNWMLSGFGQNMDRYKYPGVDGFKTGFTDLAGYCFTGTVKQGDRRLISVVMGATDDKGNLLTNASPLLKNNTSPEGQRFLVTKQLYDYGFQQFESKEIVKAGYQFKNQKNIPVVKGKSKQVGIEVKDAVQFPVKPGEEKNYKPVLHLDKSLLDKNGKLKAPIKKGQKVGYITIKYTGNGQDLGYLYSPVKVPVVTTASVDKANWFVLMFRAIGDFIGGIFSGAIDIVKGLF
jgi:serine-type D-Ala-D-Ala carboxypeptidase (penicillin-binding protein 5/6)